MAQCARVSRRRAGIAEDTPDPLFAGEQRTQRLERHHWVYERIDDAPHWPRALTGWLRVLVTRHGFAHQRQAMAGIRVWHYRVDGAVR